MGGYAFNPNSFLTSIYNDFYNNTNHVALGIGGRLKANENNFLQVMRYLVWTSTSDSKDTLDFTHNFWNSVDPIEIYQKIIDKNDRLGQEKEGPLVDISGYKLERINWINKLKYRKN
jgi:hypothetical protein